MRILLRIQDSEGMEWLMVAESDGLMVRRGEITPKCAYLQQRARFNPVINAFRVIGEGYEIDGR